MRGKGDSISRLSEIKEKLDFAFLNLPFRVKIISVIVVSLTVLVGTAITGIRKLQRQYDMLLYHTYQTVLTVSADVLNDTLKNTEEYIKAVATDSVIQDHLSAIEKGEYLSAQTVRSLERELQQYINDKLNPAVYGMCIYMDKGVFYNSTYKIDNGYDSSLGTRFTMDELEGIAWEALDKNTVWITEFSDSYGLVIAQNIRRIHPMRLDSLGVLAGCLNLQPVLHSCTTRLQQEECCFSLLDERGQVFYMYTNMGEEIDFSNQLEKDQEYAVLRQNGSSYFVIRGQVGKNDWDYLYAIPYDSIEETIRNGTANIIFTMCLCLLLAVCIAALVLRQILRDFSKLMHMIDNVSDTDFESVELDNQDMRRSDEVGVLMRRFTRMSDRIDCLIRDNYESRLLIQEAKLQALEMQINPHFLYNTLESVRCCAKLGQNDNVCSIVEALGNMMHLIMSNHNNEIRLEEEIGLIDDYILIQKLRFDQRLDFSRQVDPDCYHGVLPKLTVLPLVENAVVHGVENCPHTCQVVMEIGKRGEQIEIRIKNRGTRFAQDFLRKLRDHEITPTRHGIGLLNVDSRLKIYFKKEYRLEFYNEAQWAVAEMTIPYWTVRERDRGESYD